MKHKLCIKNLIYLIFYTNFLWAQNQWYIKGGCNLSNLAKTNGASSGNGYTIEIGREWVLIGDLNIISGLDYVMRNTKIVNKAISPQIYIDEFPSGNEVYLNDIIIKYIFYEIPVILNYKYKFNNDIGIKLKAGFTYSIPHKDFNRIREKNFLFNYDFDTDYEFEYSKTPEPVSSFYDDDFLYNFGIEFNYLKYGLDLQYIIDSREKIRVYSLSPFKIDMRSFQICMILYL